MRVRSYLALLSLIACQDANLGESTAAITNGTNDYNANDPVKQANADIVIALGNGPGNICSGTLLSAGKILTASHCLFGQNPIGPLGAIAISIGAGNPTLQSPAPKETFKTVLAGAVSANTAPWNADIAVADLDLKTLLFSFNPGGDIGTPQYAAVVNGSQWGKVVGLGMARPSFSVPPTVPAAKTTNFTNKFVSPVGSAGFDGTPVRQIAFTQFLHELGNGIWHADATDTPPLGFGCDLGDSGGPLFAIRQNGTRDAFGVASKGSSSSCLGSTLPLRTSLSLSATTLTKITQKCGSPNIPR